ncbi:MAG: ribosome biogenesis GTP-binding protein YihA/YsxC [Bacteroidales bacterium]|jgi:GTP-binding protein|nr:ribosome biogenesis GTP-binding protein YihA/YsxC [Bacteroidales bacterium]
MEIKSAAFVSSYTGYQQCPGTDLPEYAFVGRSNVGKSSLINMLLERKNLAKTSQTPGKTQLINFFLINQSWHLVDLPGYGFAKVKKSIRKDFNRLIKDYASFRQNLVCLFVLLDARHQPQSNDLQFMQWLGENQIPFAMIFTKTDKLNQVALKKNIDHYRQEMLKEWEALPEIFLTSAENKKGREELLGYIEQLNQL